MSAEYFLLGLLSFTFLATNIFWARMVRDMTARLMSRNHYEFVQAEKLKTPRAAVKLSEDEAIHPDDERQAQHLNSILGIV